MISAFRLLGLLLACTLVLESNGVRQGYAQRVVFPQVAQVTPGPQTFGGTNPAPLQPYSPAPGTAPLQAPPNYQVPAAPQQFDPYALPGDTSGNLMPNNNYLNQTNPYGANPYGTPGYGYSDPYAGACDPNCLPNAGYIDACPPLVPRPRRLTRIGATYEYLAEIDNGFEINSFDLSASLTIPFFYNQAPLTVTPGYTLTLVAGPDFVDLPPQLHDAYVDVNWRPRIGPVVGFDLTVRPTISSDFHHLDEDSFRLPAVGLGLITLSPRTTIVLGVVYPDREDVDLLPAGGVIWTPNEDTRFEIVFPRPKLSQRLPTVGNTDWWWYVQGEFGGGEWTIERDATGVEDIYSYYDLRLMLGLEFQRYQGAQGFFEVGYVFERELQFQTLGTFGVDDTILFSGGISF
ncbi:Hypothetical protein PBC10988_8000 [Planctomycetales bacterium 10988]|nr:Hypothetical protein PBC10988_8000 [Planctomycetales bacterium 10988]